jgi:hypothetical protein
MYGGLLYFSFPDESGWVPRVVPKVRVDLRGVSLLLGFLAGGLPIHMSLQRGPGPRGPGQEASLGQLSHNCRCTRCPGGGVLGVLVPSIGSTRGADISLSSWSSRLALSSVSLSLELRSTQS